MGPERGLWASGDTGRMLRVSDSWDGAPEEDPSPPREGSEWEAGTSGGGGGERPVPGRCPHLGTSDREVQVPFRGPVT